jgi:hypothetical protein
MDYCQMRMSSNLRVVVQKGFLTQKRKDAKEIGRLTGREMRVD